jgi:hypothetical protein
MVRIGKAVVHEFPVFPLIVLGHKLVEEALG